MAQNSLELKLPSRSSPPFYAKQRTLSPKEKKMDIKVDLPSSQPVQPLPQPFEGQLLRTTLEKNRPP